MKEESENEAQLKLVEEEESPVKLRILEDAERLKPDAMARVKAKTHEPHVSSIIEKETEALDLEKAWGGDKKTFPIGWSVLVALMICAVGGWVIFNLFKAQPAIEAATEAKHEIIVDYEKENLEVRKTLELMEGCVRGYLSADSVDQLLPFVRHPERVKPLMEHYYQNHEMHPREFRHFKRIRSIGMDSLSFVYGRVELQDGNSRKVLIEQLEDGSFRVDWESDVCYLPMNWEKYLSEQPSQPMDMRVTVTPDHFYAYEFRDESRLICYKIKTRDSDEHLFGFVEKGSRQAIDIHKIISKSLEHGGGKEEPLILRLRFPKETNSKRCVWIDTVLEPRWTYVNAPKPAPVSE